MSNSILKPLSEVLAPFSLKNLSEALFPRKTPSAPIDGSNAESLAHAGEISMTDETDTGPPTGKSEAFTLVDWIADNPTIFQDCRLDLTHMEFCYESSEPFALNKFCVVVEEDTRFLLV